MKFILILMLLLAAQTHAGWFTDKSDDQRLREYQQALQAERESRDRWQLIACVTVIAGVILFTIGTALGSKTRNDAKR